MGDYDPEWQDGSNSNPSPIDLEKYTKVYNFPDWKHGGWNNKLPGTEPLTNLTGLPSKHPFEEPLFIGIALLIGFIFYKRQS